MIASQAHTILKLPAKQITSENFRQYGQVIFASEHEKPYGAEDAQLNLQNGTPRFYIMRLKHNGRKFKSITRHKQCTQCLGSLEGKDWFIAVAPPNQGMEPALTAVSAFHIPGNCFIKLEEGTWHAGPYIDHNFVDFYNLELSNTNIVDHFTHNFFKSHKLEFEIT